MSRLTGAPSMARLPRPSPWVPMTSYAFPLLPRTSQDPLGPQNPIKKPVKIEKFIEILGNPKSARKIVKSAKQVAR